MHSRGYLSRPCLSSANTSDRLGASLRHKTDKTQPELNAQKNMVWSLCMLSVLLLVLLEARFNLVKACGVVKGFTWRRQEGWRKQQHQPPLVLHQIQVMQAFYGFGSALQAVSIAFASSAYFISSST